MVILPAACCTIAAIRADPARAVCSPPEVNTLSTPADTSSSSDLLRSGVTSKARWKVTLRGRESSTRRLVRSTSIVPLSSRIPRTTPSTPTSLADVMSFRITSSSSSEYEKSAPLGRIITCKGMEIVSRTARIIPRLGVIPPSKRSAHNSTRWAPPACAATADCRESTQISRTIRSFFFSGSTPFIRTLCTGGVSSRVLRTGERLALKCQISLRANPYLNEKSIRKLLEQVRQGKTSPDEAVDRLRHLPFEDLGFAKIDHHRALRVGMPEVVFGERKTPRQMAEIFKRLARHGNNVLATRATREQFAAVRKTTRQARYEETARVIVLRRDRDRYGKGLITVISAGTSDLPVAEEAAVTAEVMGNEVERLYDVGVAGIHRLLSHRRQITKSRVVIVCAGMEGALPSVVGGLVGVPVIAVPTSVGYGAAFGGMAALLGMMNSCASNVSVVNIDNGFGAGYVASLINRL